MKIFISWSGETSRALAEIFKEWLPAVVQAVKPYYSPDDVTKGSRWNNEISKELEASQVGLMCLTKDNLDAPWLMFEAGALSKNLDKAHVCPILFGVDPTDVKGPLVAFQASKFEKADVKKVVTMINRELADAGLASSVLNSVFDKWWPDLEEKVGTVLAKRPTTKKDGVRSQRDILEEVLQLSRSLSKKARSSMIGARSSQMIEGIESRRGRRPIHPMMIAEMAHMTARESAEPVAILVTASLLRDDAPWLYEMAMEVYRKAKSGTLKAAREALSQFQHVAEITMHGPFAEELGLMEMENRRFLRDIPTLMGEVVETYLRTRKRRSTGAKK